MTIRKIVTYDEGSLAIVPFTDIASFSRTYERIAAYAERSGCKEFRCTSNEERVNILVTLHYLIPHLRYIAFGQTLPAEWDDDAENFLLAIFGKGKQLQLEIISVDMTLCENEYIPAVCIFRT